ncbi:MAG: DNA methyltransferase [Rhodospirillales bacterium]
MTQEPNQNARNQQGKIGHNSRYVDRHILEKIEYVSVRDLKFYERNPRKHPKRQEKLLDRSVGAFGIVMPILIDGEGVIIAGEALAKSALRLGYTEIPVVRVTHLDGSAAKALRIALNRLSELGEWDKEKLAVEFQDLIELDFEVDLTGFEMPEIDLTLEAEQAVVPRSPEDVVPELDENVVSKVGDVWRLDEHRVGCGDARDGRAYEAILGGKRAHLVPTDMPYNVRIEGNVCGLGSVKHGEFVMGSGEMSENDFDAFMDASIANLVKFSVAGSLHYLFMDWRHALSLQRVAEKHYDVLLNLCVWAKTNGGMGSMYRSQHELVFVYKNGTCPHVNNVQLGRFGRNRTNVWEYAGCNSPSKERRADLKLHPTVKPVEMIADAIRDASNRGDLVLDAFLGSGTTIIACEQTGRVCAGLELDPKYVDVIVRRWQAYTGHRAVHAETGFSFDEMAAMRAGHQLLLPAPATGEGQ